MRFLLVDTSVWIDHFRARRDDLAEALEYGFVLCHPLVIGELACGRLDPREEILRLLSSLEQVPCASQDEALAFVEQRHLYETGLGWIDVHLLASALLGGVALWTLDRKLAAAAHSLGIDTTAR